MSTSSSNLKVMEAWLTLMSEAMRGAQQAQEAWEAWARLTGTSDELQRWMTSYLPSATAAAASPEQFQTWLREWQRLAGVVPRSDYLEVLEKNAELERRLKVAEATIESLRALLSAPGMQAEGAQQAVDAWRKLLDETLKTQSQWLQAWSGQPAQSAADDEEASER